MSLMVYGANVFPHRDILSHAHPDCPCASAFVLAGDFSQTKDSPARKAVNTMVLRLDTCHLQHAVGLDRQVKNPQQAQ